MNFEYIETLCRTIEDAIYQKIGLKVFIYSAFDACDLTLKLNVFDAITTKSICVFNIDHIDLYQKGIANIDIIIDKICEVIKPKEVKPLIGKVKPVPVCECCGGKIDFNTLTCKYCGREYYMEDIAPPPEKVESWTLSV